MSVRKDKAPFPWFGGKSKAAPSVWEALGDPPHYVEPFAGSLATLLLRPHEANRTYYSETVNDLDGFVVNVWRSIQQSPDETAEACSAPVSEADVTARHLALVRWRERQGLERLMADPHWHDPVYAGWWLYGICAWIGSGWCNGDQPWTERDGVLVKQPRGKLREPGVSRQRPHLADDGQGVHRPQLREPGVSRQRPHLGNDGQGVHRPQLREPGVGDFHPVVMPELRRWFGWLSARLRHVRIVNGDWRRVLTGGASKTLPVRQGKGPCGVFLDPPYADTADRAELYAEDSFSVAHDVREWCLEHGDDPAYRIVLAGFQGEHGTALTDAGWRDVEWFASGFLTGGMGNTGEGHQQKRERLWLSPHCLTSPQTIQTLLWETA